jgi:hypothetical protein
MIELLAKNAGVAGQRLQVRSALNPLLWLTAVTTPACLYAAFAFRSETAIAIGLLILCAAPVLATIGIAVFFAVKSPEKLQSEDYQLRHETLQLVQAKAGHLAVDPTSLQAIANPAHQLPPQRNGGEQ